MSPAVTSLILAASVQASGSAEPPGPSSTPKTPAPTSHANTRDAEIGLAKYLDCVVRNGRRRDFALQYLRMDPADPETAEFAIKLSTPDCVMDAVPREIEPDGMEQSARAGQFGPVMFDLYSLRMPPEAFRNGLYPALYRYSYGKTGPGRVADKPLLTVSGEWDVVPEPLPEGWRIRRAIGDCAARGHPEASHRFVTSVPWSDAETAELTEVVTAIAECLPEGETVALGREDVRGILGEALYKLATAPAALPTSTPDEVN